MEHQCIAVRVGEEGHVAYARVEGVAREGHATRFQRGSRLLDVVDV